MTLSRRPRQSLPVQLIINRFGRLSIDRQDSNILVRGDTRQKSNGLRMCSHESRSLLGSSGDQRRGRSLAAENHPDPVLRIVDIGHSDHASQKHPARGRVQRNNDRKNRMVIRPTRDLTEVDGAQVARRNVRERLKRADDHDEANPLGCPSNLQPDEQRDERHRDQNETPTCRPRIDLRLPSSARCTRYSAFALHR